MFPELFIMRQSEDRVRIDEVKTLAHIILPVMLSTRQYSTIIGVKTETAEKPLKLGTFVIRLDATSRQTGT